MCLDDKVLLVRIVLNYSLGIRLKRLSLENNYQSGICPVEFQFYSSMLFYLYVKPLAEIIHSFGPRFHQYADDTCSIHFYPNLLVM